MLEYHNSWSGLDQDLGTCICVAWTGAFSSVAATAFEYCCWSPMDALEDVFGSGIDSAGLDLSVLGVGQSVQRHEILTCLFEHFRRFFRFFRNVTTLKL